MMLRIMSRPVQVLLASACLVIAGNAFAQHAQSIITQPNYGLDVYVDRDTTGQGVPTYYFGDKIRVGVKTYQSSYVYLYNVRANGEVAQILPNSYDSDNYIAAGQTVTYPRHSGYDLSVDGPAGNDQVVAVASALPLSLQDQNKLKLELSPYGGRNYTATSYAQTLSIVVNPTPQQQYWMDVANFSVQPQYTTYTPPATTYTPPATTYTPPATTYTPPATTYTPPATTYTPPRTTTPAPAQQGTGTLAIQATLPNSIIYINNQHDGYANSSGLYTTSLAVGTYQIQVAPPTSQSHYKSYNGTVSINDGQTTSISASQSPH